MGNTRKLKLFEEVLGNYEVSGVIYSGDDVIDFVDSKKQGIVLIDICGPIKGSGERMTEFLREEILKGWGVSGDAKDELLVLGRKLAAKRDPELNSLYNVDGDEWHDFVSGLYLQFNGETISLSTAGGLGRTLILRADGDLEKILMKGGTLDGPFLKRAEPAYNFELKEGEVILLNSDGLIGNILFSVCRDVKMGKIEDPKDLSGYSEGLVVDCLKRHQDKQPYEIRDALVSELSKRFIPHKRHCDDVTFAVVKKR